MLQNAKEMLAGYPEKVDLMSSVESTKVIASARWDTFGYHDLTQFVAVHVSSERASIGPCDR